MALAEAVEKGRAPSIDRHGASWKVMVDRGLGVGLEPWELRAGDAALTGPDEVWAMRAS